MKSKIRGQDFMRHATNVRVQINPSADPAYSRDFRAADLQKTDLRRVADHL